MKSHIDAAVENGHNPDHLTEWILRGHVKATLTGPSKWDVDEAEVAAIRQWTRPEDFAPCDYNPEQALNATCRWVQRRAAAKDEANAKARLGAVAMAERALRVGFATFTVEMKERFVLELLDATHASGLAQANVEVLIRKYIEGGK